MSNLEWLEGMIKEARKNLSDAILLQKKYPDSYGIKMMIWGWESHIKELEQKTKAEKEQKEIQHD